MHCTVERAPARPHQFMSIGLLPFFSQRRRTLPHRLFATIVSLVPNSSRLVTPSLARPVLLHHMFFQ